MGTIWVREFTGGLDVRKLPETSAGGTLMRATNGHLTRGGEFEQRADFVEAYTLPAGLTKGLAATADGLVVFGHQTAPALPADIGYRRLEHPSGEALDRVLYNTLYRGEVQSVGRFADGSRYVFAGNTRITDTAAPPNAAGSGTPSVLLTQVEKLFIGSSENLFFSAVGDNLDFGSGAGAGEGFIVMSTHADGAEDIKGLARYDNFTAVFARRTVQIWFFDPDPTLSRQNQVLSNTGTLSSRAVTQFGDGDVFYLDLSGIRSLRARDSSNSAATTDIGSAIDPLVLEQMNAVGDDAVSQAIGVIEPTDGRFWLAIKDRIFVFSYFTASRISAWTEYRPGFDVDDMVVFNDRVWIRSGDTVYVYGGLPGEAYQYSDDTVAEAWLPYLDADEPFRLKHFDGVDVACRGTWSVALAMDPNDPKAEDRVAVVDRTT
jgi:hypothetical protein